MRTCANRVTVALMAEIKLCETCQHPEHDHPGEGCTAVTMAAMRKLLGLIGQAGKCRACLAPIFWVIHTNGKNVPYTPAGLNHFINCPAREEFRKPRL